MRYKYNHELQRSVAASMRAWRDGAGLSLSEMGLALGVTKAKLANIETGRTMPTTQDLALWAQRMGMKVGKVAELLLGDAMKLNLEE